MSAFLDMRIYAKQGSDYSTHGQRQNRAAGRDQEEQDRYSFQRMLELKAETALLFSTIFLLAFQVSDTDKVLLSCCKQNF